MTEPLLNCFADDRGVWQRSPTGRQFGIEWREIYRVSGYKLDCITHQVVLLALDYEWGEYIEFDAEQPGFEQVVTTLTAQLAGIEPDWYRKLEQSESGRSLIVWQRPSDGPA